MPLDHALGNDFAHVLAVRQLVHAGREHIRLNSLTWGQDGAQPQVIVPVRRDEIVAGRRPATERAVEPPAPSKYAERA